MEKFVIALAVMAKKGEDPFVDRRWEIGMDTTEEEIIAMFDKAQVIGNFLEIEEVPTDNHTRWDIGYKMEEVAKKMGFFPASGDWDECWLKYNMLTIHPFIRMIGNWEDVSHKLKEVLEHVNLADKYYYDYQSWKRCQEEGEEEE